MKTPIIIIPAAGKSSRFNGDAPKWMRTHPDGELMIQKSIKTFENIKKSRIYIITTDEIDKKYDVTLKLSQAIPHVNIILLKNETKSSVETIYQGLNQIKEKFDLDTPLFLKDADNLVTFDLSKIDLKYSFSVGVKINDFEITRIHNKSFFIIENDFIIDFIEKRIVSNIISVGTHYFSKISEFLIPSKKILDNISNSTSEIYVSHVIADNIYNKVNFKIVFAENYKDYGTQADWDRERNNYKTIFCDFDGTLVHNVGKYGKIRWELRNDKVIQDNIDIIKNHFQSGSQIIITTSRPNSEKEYIREFLLENGIKIYDIICGLNHSERLIINDYYYTNSFPTATAINIERNSSLDLIMGKK